MISQRLSILVINHLLKEPHLDPDVLDPDRTSCSFKIIGKVSANRSCDHLHVSDVSEEFQSGSKVHHSSEAALVKVTNDTVTASERGSASILVLLDLRAAFDPIDQNISYFITETNRKLGLKENVLR